MKAKRQLKIPKGQRIHPDNRSCGEIFVDSGAVTLYSKFAREHKHSEDHFKFFQGKQFWSYVDDYAKFIKKYEHLFDYYANCDVIFDPETSWKVLKYLEEKHGLHPVPVIHYGASKEWIERHLEAGYDFICLGGSAGKDTPRTLWRAWADSIFTRICPPPDHLPIVRVHGFAITAYKILRRYPWWSVDSTSWAKWAAYGICYIPHLRSGEYTFDVDPYMIFVSIESPYQEVGRHISTLPKEQLRIAMQWFEHIGVPFGSETEWGVCSKYDARCVANLRFFEKMLESLPDYPWPFKVKMQPRRLLEDILDG